jgi:hypothetical protein
MPLSGRRRPTMALSGPKRRDHEPAGAMINESVSPRRSVLGSTNRKRPKSLVNGSFPAGRDVQPGLALVPMLEVLSGTFQDQID